MIVELQIKEMNGVGGGLCICNLNTSPTQYPKIVNVDACMSKCCTTIGNTWNVFTVNGKNMQPVGNGVCNKVMSKKKKGGGKGGKGSINIRGNNNVLFGVSSM